MDASEAPTIQLPRVKEQETLIHHGAQKNPSRYNVEDVYTDEMWIVRGSN